MACNCICVCCHCSCADVSECAMGLSLYLSGKLFSSSEYQTSKSSMSVDYDEKSIRFKLLIEKKKVQRKKNGLLFPLFIASLRRLLNSFWLISIGIVASPSLFPIKNWKTQININSSELVDIVGIFWTDKSPDHILPSCEKPTKNDLSEYFWLLYYNMKAECGATLIQIVL